MGISDVVNTVCSTPEALLGTSLKTLQNSFNTLCASLLWLVVNLSDKLTSFLDSF